MSAQGPQIATVALSHSPQMAQDTGHLQGRRFRAGFAQVANAVADYQPTLAIYFGPDHMRALAGIAPCFTVVEAASGYGDWGTPQEDYRVPHERASRPRRAPRRGWHRHRTRATPAAGPRVRAVHIRPLRITVSRPAHPDRHQLR